MGRQRVLEPVGKHRPIERRECRGGEIGARKRYAGRIFAGGTGTDLVVLRIVSGVVRHHGVGVVVAAVQEYAHQCLVVSGVESRGLADGGEVDRERRRHTQRRKLHGALQDETTRPEIHFCTR